MRTKIQYSQEPPKKIRMGLVINCKKTIIAFERQRYILKRCFENTIEWKCTQCKLVTISTMDNQVIKRTNITYQHANRCQMWK
jgi:hypothetical protein